MTIDEFEVIENRGSGIQYSVFEGTELECKNWMSINTKAHPTNWNIFVNKNEDKNGNGDYFHYYIIKK